MNRKSTSETLDSAKNQTDWKLVDAMQDDEIDMSDVPELSPEDFAEAIVRDGFKPVVRKQQITLRIDEDVLAWFRDRGPGYQTRMNEVLRAYVDACTRSAE